MNKQLLQMEMRTGLVKGSGLLYVVVCFVGECTNLHKPLCPCRVYGPLEINVFFVSVSVQERATNDPTEGLLILDRY